jgi:hypothetical protein
LLDHLAATFVQDEWSLKRTLRRLATSATYRMSGCVDPEADVADPENCFWHYRPMRRMAAEVLRDSVLVAAGQLDETMYGPSVPVYLTPFMQGRGRPDRSGPLDGDRRRSIYLEVRRNFLAPMMLAFDAPSPFNAVGRRTISNVPSQALMLLNHPFVAEQSDAWARRLIAREAEPARRLERLFVEAYARPIEPPEAEAAQEFIESQRQRLAESGTPTAELEPSAWRDLCHVLINSKEFYYIQ